MTASRVWMYIRREVPCARCPSVVFPTPALYVSHLKRCHPGLNKRAVSSDIERLRRELGWPTNRDVLLERKEAVKPRTVKEILAELKKS